jgi:hypothetical protein
LKVPNPDLSNLYPVPKEEILYRLIKEPIIEFEREKRIDS